MSSDNKTESYFSKITRISKPFVYISIVVLSLVFSFQTSHNPLIKGELNTDSSVFYYIAKTMLLGKMPYRDSFDHKGPLIYIIDYLSLIISEDFGLWIIELITIFVSMYFMYRIARLICNDLESLFVLIISFVPMFSYFEGGNLVEEYALPFISMSLFFFIDYLINDSVTVLRLLFCGAGLGAVCFLRPNMISLWFCFCIGILIRHIKEKKCKELFERSLFFLFGFAIVAIPIFIWLVKENSIVDFWKDYIIFNISYSGSPDMSLWAKMKARGTTLVYFLSNTIVLISIMIQLYITVKYKRSCDIVFTLFFMLNLMLISMSGFQFGHYGMISVPAVIYPYSRMVERFHHKDCSDSRAMGAVLLFLLLIFILPPWAKGAYHVLWAYNNRNESMISKENLKTADLIKKNCGKDEKIVVCGNWYYLYILSERFSCTRYSYQNFPCRIDKNNNREFMDELAHEMPRIVVICDSAYVKNEVSDFCLENDYKRLDTEEDGLTGKSIYIKP